MATFSKDQVFKKTICILIQKYKIWHLHICDENSIHIKMWICIQELKWILEKKMVAFNDKIYFNYTSQWLWFWSIIEIYLWLICVQKNRFFFFKIWSAPLDIILKSFNVFLIFFLVMDYSYSSFSEQYQQKNFVDPDDLFSKIREIRTSLNLPNLAKNRSLDVVARQLVRTQILAPIDESKMNYVILSIFSILDAFDDESTDSLLNRWLHDQSKRSVILAPGNYASVFIDYDEENDNQSGKIALIVASVCFPNEK